MAAETFIEKVDPVVAAGEVTRWLDQKRVMPKKRESLKEQIETMTDAIVHGVLSIDEEGVITHKLLYPLEGFAEELTYKPRIRVEDVQARLKNQKSTDVDARILATMAALTGKSMGVLAKLDSEDLSVAQSIVIFFA